MSIEKKSLINTLKTTKKANVASSGSAKAETVTPKRLTVNTPKAVLSRKMTIEPKRAKN
jgi:hypothetical protein